MELVWRVGGKGKGGDIVIDGSGLKEGLLDVGGGWGEKGKGET